MPKLKIKTITTDQVSLVTMGCKAKPECIIDLVPMRKRYVGIGWVTEDEATAEDFKKYPVLLRPWLNEKNL
jgi:hypothetical protein